MPAQLVTIGCRDGAIALPGLRTNSMTYEVSKLLSKGWRVHVRGPRLIFEGPKCNGKRMAYVEATSKYILGWAFDTDDDLQQTDKWSSGMPIKVETPVTAPVPGAADDFDDDAPVDTVASRGKPVRR